jgi:hypothetical protein
LLVRYIHDQVIFVGDRTRLIFCMANLGSEQ